MLTVKKILLLCYILLATVFIAFFIPSTKVVPPKQEKIDVIGIYILPVGSYEVLSVTNKGFAAPDELTNTFVYKVKNTSSGEHLYVQLICPPEFAWKIGYQLQIEKPGEVRVSTLW